MGVGGGDFADVADVMCMFPDGESLEFFEDSNLV